MKITVSETRECCQHRDLKPVGGQLTPKRGRDPMWMFCQHCGRHHRGESERDPAGSTDWVYKPQPWPWAAVEPSRELGMAAISRCSVHGADGRCEKELGHAGPHQAVGGCFSTTVSPLVVVPADRPDDT